MALTRWWKELAVARSSGDDGRDSQQRGGCCWLGEAEEAGRRHGVLASGVMT